MPSISPLIAHVFDESNGNRRVKRAADRNRDRSETKGRVLRRRPKPVD
jgi:hypothetical protein